MRGLGRPLGEGRFQFVNLHAGEYRVRSENPAFSPAEDEILLGTGDKDRIVRLRLTPARHERVEFAVRLPDGAVPQFVTLQITPGAARTSTTVSRFATSEEGGRSAGVHTRAGRYVLDAETGLLPLTLNTGTDTRLLFTTEVEGQGYAAELVVPSGAGADRHSVTLTASSQGEGLIGDGQPRRPCRLEIALTLNGKPAAFTRVNLRQQMHDVQARDPTRVQDGVFMFDGVLSGRWWVAAQGTDFHAAFVARIDVTGDGRKELDVRTGHVRVQVSAGPGVGDAARPAGYQVKLRPRGIAALERVFQGQVSENAGDFIDFHIPEGECQVEVQSASNGTLDVDPPQQNVNIGAGARITIEFAARAGCSVRFQLLQPGGVPLAGAEFLFTTFAAGSVPSAEKSRVRSGDIDGRCTVANAPAGPVYLMVWSASTDWNNPDRVFRLDLPANQATNLGGITIEP